MQSVKGSEYYRKLQQLIPPQTTCQEVRNAAISKWLITFKGGVNWSISKISKICLCPSVVVHTYNSSYLRGVGRRIGI
jgi:hypothetical protein